MSDHIAYTLPKPPNKLPTSNGNIPMFLDVLRCVYVFGFEFFFHTCMQICRPNEHIEVKAISVRYLEKWHERGSDLLPDKAMMECSKPSYTCRVTIIINLLVYSHRLGKEYD